MILTEDQVVDAVCRTLESDGYSIAQRALATQHGYDIVARKNGVELIIEAKGAREARRRALPGTASSSARTKSSTTLRKPS
jgi:Holliday junction resolvase-like predicted endonuclease